MDDQSGRTSEEVGAGQNGVPMIFKLTGVVYDNNGNPLASQPVKADLLYWTLANGVSTKVTDTVSFTTGIGGAYVQWYKGQNNPIPLWQAEKGLAVAVYSGQPSVWTTQTQGQYNGDPTGASPITIVVSDTILKHV